MAIRCRWLKGLPLTSANRWILSSSHRISEPVFILQHIPFSDDNRLHDAVFAGCISDMIFSCVSRVAA